MKGPFPDWRSTVAITCSLAVILVALVWNIRKRSSKTKSKEKDASESEAKSPKKLLESKANSQNPRNISTSQEESDESETESSVNEGISDLPRPRWIKVGTVKELYCYPLKSGRGRNVSECNFTVQGISLESPGKFALRDRMFLVYNEENGRYQTGRKYPTMILVSISAADNFKAKMEAVGMPSVVFQVPENSKSSTEAIECTMWWGESIKCIDCGPEPAEWISRFLTGMNSGLRLACAVDDGRDILKGPWERHAKVYDKLRSEDGGLFSDITSYMLMTSQSLDELNAKLDQPVPSIQFRPNIVVSGHEPFAEDNWEWIKIGESAVIRNVKPCSRCKMVRLDPQTGIPAQEEPLKTLQSFREPTNPEQISVDGKAPTLGIYCGLYITGKVSIGDDVFVHVPDDSMEISYQLISPMGDS